MINRKKLLILSIKGQLLIESLIAIPVIFGLSFMIFYFGYFSFIRVYAEFLTSEVLICLQTDTHPNSCETSIKKKIQNILFFKKNSKVEFFFEMNENYSKAKVAIKIPHFQKIIIVKQIYLPLETHFIKGSYRVQLR